MEQPPFSTDRALSEYLFRQLAQLEAKINDLQNSIRKNIIMDQWKFTTTTTDTDPGANYLGINAALKADATKLYINKHSNTNMDLYDILLNLKIRDIIALSLASNTTDYAYYYVSGIPIDGTTYIKIPLLKKSTGGAEFANNAVLNFGVAY